MKKIFSFLLALVLFLGLFSPSFAIEDPLNVPNNRFGIHITDESDLEKAQKLVNSTGGDWGYITLVIREDERDINRWQKVFDQMRQLHLIPIVRIATSHENGGWKKLETSQIENWVSFLNSLNWVVKNRYVVVGNEPNHAKEWSGEVSPEEYAEFLVSFSQKLKTASGDFFVLPAGLDASAPYSTKTLPEDVFLRQAVKARPDFFGAIDAWNSHSYPNPGFSGSENGVGRGSVRTYVWELEFIKSLGVQKELPVFITETGWLRTAENENQVLGAKFGTAFSNAWSEEQVVAVTPFILNYQAAPFEPFSWLKPNGEAYGFYATVQGLAKVKGEPVQITRAELVSSSSLYLGKKTYGSVVLKNTGQSIWQKSEFEAILVSETVKPGEKGVFFFETDETEVEIVKSGKALAKLSLNSRSPLSNYGHWLMAILSSIW
jgi:hypothetical protein